MKRESRWLSVKILYNWLNDLPQQFLEKERIEAVIKAFSKQMEEVNSAFMELETLTDIDSATGKNLDMVGTIVPVSRTEAQEGKGNHNFR